MPMPTKRAETEQKLEQRKKELFKIAANENAFYDFIDSDLLSQPHMFIAAMTGSGKSFFLMRLIMDLFVNAAKKGDPRNITFRIIDPKYIKGKTPWGSLVDLPMNFFTAKDTHDYGELEDDPIVVALDSGEIMTVVLAIERLDVVIQKIHGRRRRGEPEGGFPLDVTFIDEWMECLAIAGELDKEIARVKRKKKSEGETEEYIPESYFQDMLKFKMSHIARIGRAVNCFLVLVSQTTNVDVNGFSDMGGAMMRRQFAIIGVAREGRNDALLDVIGNTQLFRSTDSTDVPAISQVITELSTKEKKIHKDKKASGSSYIQRGLIFTTNNNGEIYQFPNISGAINQFNAQLASSEAVKSVYAEGRTIERDKLGSDKPLHELKRIAFSMLYDTKAVFDPTLEGAEYYKAYINERKNKRKPRWESELENKNES